MNNPWTFEDWNVTEQGLYVVKFGLLAAEKAAKEAGTTVGGPKPNAPPGTKVIHKNFVLNKKIGGTGTGTGPAGPPGPQGPAGPQGPQGVAGNTGATGAQGPIGNTGATGAAGTNGTNGVRGSLWYTGTGAPGTIGGQLNGDDYLNTTNGDVYSLVSGTWTLQGNIRGPAGATGATGATGSTGATGAAGTNGARGSVWRTGSAVPTVIAGDANGDFYVRSTNGEVYMMTAGAWVDQSFTLQGPQGPAGTPAPTSKGFSVHRNSVQQTGVVSATDTKVMFTTALYNDGSLFDLVNSHWTPPAGPIMMCAALDTVAPGTFDSIGESDCRMFKNGSFFKGQYTYCAFTSDHTAFITIMDVANGTDYYELFCRNTTTSGTYAIAGNPNWTWWMGRSMA